MNYQEAIVGPIYFVVILLIAYVYRERIGDVELQKHFLRGLTYKLIGAVGIYFLYFFYYKGGDTSTYYRKAMYIDNVLFSDFKVGLKLFFSDPKLYDFDTVIHFQSLTAEDKATYLVAKFCAMTNLVCFNSYLGNAYLFAVLSFVGIWKTYMVFVDIYPNRKKELAIAFLYIPSVFFWGSGVLKDSLTIGFLGLIISGLYQIFLKRENIILNLLYIASGIYIVGAIKSYILLAFMPAAIIWIFLTYRNNIKSNITRYLATPVFLALIVVGGYFVLTLLGSAFSKFSLDTLEVKAKGMQQWHTQVVELYQGGEGSSYNLGVLEFTPIGIIKKIPAAINVALFRPWPWEARNAIMVFESIESTIFLLITLSLLYLILLHPWISFNILVRNSTIIFLFVFAFIFAFSVGFTSYNFGALSRYRIPLLPFYISAVLLLRIELMEYLQYQHNKKIEAAEAALEKLRARTK